jgi:hypothetical protein
MEELQIVLLVLVVNIGVLGIIGVAAYALNKSTRTQFKNRTRGE